MARRRRDGRGLLLPEETYSVADCFLAKKSKHVVLLILVKLCTRKSKTIPWGIVEDGGMKYNVSGMKWHVLVSADSPTHLYANRRIPAHAGRKESIVIAGKVPQGTRQEDHHYARP